MSKEQNLNNLEKIMKTLIVSILTVLLLTFCTAGITDAQDKAADDGHSHGKMMQGMMHHKAEMLKKLKLTKEQKDKIADLRTSFQKSMIDMRADLKKNEIDLKSFRSKDNVTREDIISGVEKVNKSKNAISLAFANHLFDMYTVLTPDQQKIFKENFHGMDRHEGGRKGRMGFDGGGHEGDDF
jgi:Spy/CpxP family protein refolding chaperone